MDTPKPDLIFDLGHFLGDGGQADVFLLRLRATGSVFAGKFLREVWDPSAREAFKKEAERQARVASDHIVRIVTWNFDVPKPFVVMEYMPRGSLAKEVERRGGFTVQEAIHAAHRIAVALADLHHQRVVHRDVKPGNVLVDADGRLRLSDLGLAATLTFSDFVRTHGFVGTEGYAAPEQYQGLALPQSDVFALGRILRELILSRPDGAIASLGQRALLVADRFSMKEWRSRPTAREAIAMLAELMPRSVAPAVTLPVQPAAAATPPLQPPRPPPVQPARPAPTPSGGGGGLAAFLGVLAAVGLAAAFSGGGSNWDPDVERYRGRDGRFKKG